MDRDLFFPPRLRLLLHAAATGALAGVGLLLVTASGSGFWRGAGALALVLFGLATAVLVIRAGRPGPTVVVDAEGVTDRTALLPHGLVRWEEIAGVRKREIGRGTGRERLLEIILLDPDRFRTRPRGPARRLADRYRRLIRQPAVTIPGSMVAVPLAAVAASIQRRQPYLDVAELPPRRPGIWERLTQSKAFPVKRQHPDTPHW